MRPFLFTRRLPALAAIIVALGISSADANPTGNMGDTPSTSRPSAVTTDNALTLAEWFAAKRRLAASLSDAISRDDPLPALQALEASGGFLTVYMAYPHTNIAVFSDGWQPPGNYDPRERPWYRQAEQAGRTIMTSPYMDLISNTPVTSFVHPYYDDSGRLMGVVGADISLNGVAEIVERIQPTPASFAFLVSKDGTILAHPDSDLLLEESTVLNEQLSIDAIKTLSTTQAPLSLMLDGRQRLLEGHKVGRDGYLIVALDERDAMDSR